ncbi:hypothetical protein PHYPSEUDO_004087 [Phytophthora pseudosyringae]|uniref:Bzip transcription factor n=1 Tax=Phytophthora pseudosyringae TaxID=221518 RepID=A0A8T1WED7_9STRA|nr:hypothetical protein PHYPSEUDO_004087 [Phytophthora pseudosyringae]
MTSRCDHFEGVHTKLSARRLLIPDGRTWDRHVSCHVILQTPLESAAEQMPPVPHPSTKRFVSSWRRDSDKMPAESQSRGDPLVSGFSRNKTASSQVGKTPATDLRASFTHTRDDAERANPVEMKKAIRREQCRTNQARYRDRQRAHQRREQQRVHELHEAVQSLKLKRQRLLFGERANRSPWSLVSDVFRLVETSFRSPWLLANADEMRKNAETRQILATLQKSFTHDVAMGALSGVDALLEQLQCYSLYFSEPHVHLQRVEELVPGVVTATARLRLAVSELTLRCVFPHLEETQVADADDDDLRSLRKKLLGQTLDCSCKVTLLMDDESGRVGRLETQIDLGRSLFQVLKDASAVSTVLGQTLLVC